MYDRVGNAERAPEAGAGPAGEEALLVLARVGQLLSAYLPGMACDAPRLLGALAAPFTDPGREGERLFAVGWLHWLQGDPAAAEPPLAEALARGENAGHVGDLPFLPACAYWLARVRLLLGRADALGGYESLLRTLGGSPRATAWYVDLLGRAGRPDRADGVWKSVRANRRVLACDEGPLLEARALLRRGEVAPAERVLRDSAPAGGVAWVERRLLLAWAFAELKQFDRARASLDEAASGPYPPAVLALWRIALEARSRPTHPDPSSPPPYLHDLADAQQARAGGEPGRAVPLYRAALVYPPARPFARYGLACLGEEDPAALLASGPALFLAARCRARLALGRFRLRQATPAEVLDALAHADHAGYRSPAVGHFRALAEALRRREVDRSTLEDLLTPTQDASPPVRRNAFRVAVELAAGRLPAAQALALLAGWARLPWLAGEPDLRTLLGRHLLRLVLLTRQAYEPELAALESLLPEDARVPLARALLRRAPEPLRADRHPAFLLWHAAGVLAEGPPHEELRAGLRALHDERRYGAPARALLLHDAVRRGDAPAVAGLLEFGAWRGFGTAPRSLLRALAAFSAAPNFPAWRQALAGWLGLWDAQALGPPGATLAVLAGLPGARADEAEVPPGMEPAPWFLHQAARALAREDARAALTFAGRALEADPDLAGVPQAEVVRAALAELRNRAATQGLADCLAGPGGAPPAGALADLVDRLGEVPGGQSVLEAALAGDHGGVREGFAALAGRTDLPARLAHHLALVESRLAAGLDEQGRTREAVAGWGRAWVYWLRFLGFSEPPLPPARRGLLLDHLLTTHRHRVSELLARGAVDEARAHWDLVEGLPARAEAVGHELGRDLAGRVGSFGEELATEYLLGTREAMRYGAIPEGWRADYEKGLEGLRRFLSLDRDNVRLLTALVETCAEWFLDLYHAGDGPALRRQAERYTPFALQLGRLLAGRPADLAARGALSEFTKFRGFLAPDRAEKVALYREALRLNPANANARDLLAELGEEAGPPSHPDPSDEPV